jgi:hypothetical protein
MTHFSGVLIILVAGAIVIACFKFKFPTGWGLTHAGRFCLPKGSKCPKIKADLIGATRENFLIARHRANDFSSE